MIGKFLRNTLLCASFSIAMLANASGGIIKPAMLHFEDVDVTRYPWSSIGKLYNETGGACSGVVISSDSILTAAHCLFNYRTQRFIPAASLHFLVGYRTGRYAAHARIASYEIGAGFDPLRYQQTLDADWAVLTLTERLPADIQPLQLGRDLLASGAKATIAGYPQDRAHAMTADRDCELRERIVYGRLFLHTCRGISGYSGAPILVSAGGNEVQIAGIHIGIIRVDGAEKMLAVSTQTIEYRERKDEPTTPSR